MDALRSTHRHAAAIAAGIHALEIHLKIQICKALRLHSLLRTFEIHDLEGLLILTGYHQTLNGESLRTTEIKENWDEILVAAANHTDLRYQAAEKWTKLQAMAFHGLLMDEKAGVISWLRNLDMRDAVRRVVESFRHYAKSQNWKKEDFRILYETKP